MAERGRYLYAVCRGLDAADLSGIVGLGGGPVELVTHGDLAAVVDSVDLAEFGEEGLRSNLEDLGWLERAARGHDAVIQALALRATTAPLRLATICLDDDGVRERLREWYVALLHVLDRIEGRVEWSVKVFAPARVEPQVAVPAVGSGGAAYLMRKKAETEARSAAEDDAAQAADAVHLALAARSVAGRSLPAQDPRLTGHEGTMVHNGAYLVEAEESELFAAEVDRLRADHPSVVIDCAGPWPPYSFAMLEQR